MTQTEFLTELANLLGARTADLQLDRDLATLPGWDSMGQLSTLSLLDEIGIHPPKGAIHQCRSVRDVVNLADSKLKRE